MAFVSGRVAAKLTSRKIVVSIEDDELSRLVLLTLKHGPYEAVRAENYETLVQMVANYGAHLVLLDIDDADGRSMNLIDDRDDGKLQIPLIALTRRSDLRRQLEALDRGADDCIGVPFVPGDLIARIHAVLRRSYGKSPTTFRPVRIGDIEIDIVARDVRRKGEQVHLTALEQALLYLLASNAGTVVSRDRILDAIWGADFLGESNVIDRHVRSLRAKLQNGYRNPTYIETVTGDGYRFIVEAKAT